MGETAAQAEGDARLRHGDKVLMQRGVFSPDDIDS
jgi:hypothetical protein